MEKVETIVGETEMEKMMVTKLFFFSHDVFKKASYLMVCFDSDFYGKGLS